MGGVAGDGGDDGGKYNMAEGSVPTVSSWNTVPERCKVKPTVKGLAPEINQQDVLNR
jgi:hypothetical protein